MSVSRFNKPCCFSTITHGSGFRSLKGSGVNLSTGRFSCLLFLTFSRGPLMSRRGRIGQRRRAEEGGGRDEGSDESSPSLQGAGYKSN